MLLSATLLSAALLLAMSDSAWAFSQTPRISIGKRCANTADRFAPAFVRLKFFQIRRVMRPKPT
jgi:hypothetical protein